MKRFLYTLLLIAFCIPTFAQTGRGSAHGDPMGTDTVRGWLKVNKGIFWGNPAKGNTVPDSIPYLRNSDGQLVNVPAPWVKSSNQWQFSDTIHYYFPVGKIYSTNFHYAIAPILYINEKAINWKQENITQNSDSGYLDFTYYKGVNDVSGYINYFYNKADVPTNTAANEDTWTPAQMPGLVAEGDFSDLSKVKYSDTTLLIDSLLDKKGSYRYVKSTNTQPTLRYYGAPNNKPYADFTNGKYLKSTTLALSQPFTIYMVMKQNSYTNNTGVLDFNGVSGTNGLWNKSNYGPTAPYTRALGPVSSVAWSSLTYPYMYSEKWSVFRFSYAGDTDITKTAIDGSPYVKMYGGNAGMTFFQINNGANYSLQHFWITNNSPSDSDDMRIRKYILKESRIKPKPFLVSFGTSISAGFNAVNNNSIGYIDQTAVHFGLPLFNYAYSGSTLDSDANNFYFTRKQKGFQGVVNPGDGWVIIEMGTNDGVSYVLNNPTWKSRYKQSVNEFIAYGYTPNHIILVSRFYTKASLLSTYNAEDSLIRTIANETGTHFLNVDSFMRNNGGLTWSSDSTHPTAAGHAGIASFLIRKMFEWSNGTLAPIYNQYDPSGKLQVYLKDERDVISQTFGQVERGRKIYCSDCTNLDGTTGTEQTWNGTAWVNIPGATYSDASAVSTSAPAPTGSSRFNTYYLTALAATATFAAPSGTPANGNQLSICLKDNGSAQTISWNAIYTGSTSLPLPTTTTAGKYMYADFIYNSAAGKWHLVNLQDGL